MTSVVAVPSVSHHLLLLIITVLTWPVIPAAGDAPAVDSIVTDSPMTSLPVSTTSMDVRRDADPRSSAPAPKCRLLTEDQYVHRKLNKMAAERATDLVEFELTIAGGYQPTVGEQIV